MADKVYARIRAYLSPDYTPESDQGAPTELDPNNPIGQARQLGQDLKQGVDYTGREAARASRDLGRAISGTKVSQSNDPYSPEGDIGAPTELDPNNPIGRARQLGQDLKQGVDYTGREAARAARDLGRALKGERPVGSGNSPVAPGRSPTPSPQPATASGRSPTPTAPSQSASPYSGPTNDFGSAPGVDDSVYQTTLGGKPAYIDKRTGQIIRDSSKLTADQRRRYNDGKGSNLKGGLNSPNPTKNTFTPSFNSPSLTGDSPQTFTPSFNSPSLTGDSPQTFTPSFNSPSLTGDTPGIQPSSSRQPSSSPSTSPVAPGARQPPK